jgi:hypothetical protein
LRLARSGFTDQTQSLSRIQIETDAVDGVDNAVGRIEGNGQIADFK